MSNQYCPLCHNENQCMVGGDKDCWCTTETFPERLLLSVPLISRRKQCICKKCLENYKEKHIEKNERFDNIN
ncbi:cysteine-rich CWC family protein [Metabacillus malikii]|uniref:Cysteine-rich CWC family protein n=1 Tax=Metabacillus malikii TaxID=1504265 RepID=A0ABT9ZMW7_9BACI|nr:cysteine-rich CWC family protein [Metabacillus malikii]MDQ0233269.1 hypothetical protein [Metabacillus malikii]